MEINDFDKLIKEQMSKMEIAPSAGIKKALAFKLFFNNLILFHKVKLVAGLFLISTGVYLGVSYSGNESVPVIEKNIAENKAATKILVSSNQDENLDSESSSKVSDVYEDAKQGKDASVFSEGVISSNEDIGNNRASESQPDITSKEEMHSVATYISDSQVKGENKSSTSDATNNIDVALSNSSVSYNKNVTKSQDEISDNSENLEEVLENKFTLDDRQSEDKSLQKFDVKDAVVFTTDPELDNSFPEPVVVKPIDDYVNNPKKRGLTLDGYFSPFNKVDIDNQLDEYLATYHWDFYKEHGYVSSGYSGGINVNYNWNNFKLGTGLQLSTLRDYKSEYKYFYLQGTNSGNYIIPTVSSAVVYGEDTTLVFHADPLNTDLHEEIEKEYNTYTYIKVPLTLGYELDLKYFSFELNAGVEYGHLMKTNGIEVKTGNVINDPIQVYFYSDKYVDMMSRKSSNLNKHQFSLLANATLRFRLTPSFDLYTSVNYTQSQSGIYDNKYFLQKTYKNYGAKFGVTYYLNKRLKLKETISTGF